MKIRSLAAVVTVAAFAITSCGGGDDGPLALSEDDFIDELADICKDTERDIDRIDLPETIADYEDAASEALEVLNETRERLAEVEPPEDLADDYEDFVKVLDDQIEAVEDLQEAGADEDEDAADEAGEIIGELNERRSELGEDLGVDECVSDEDDPSDTTDVTTDDTDPADTTDPAVTQPATTNPPLTLPPTLPPQTAPPATTPPVTAPPETAPPSTGVKFSVVDLSNVFNAPDGFVLQAADPAAQQDFIDVVASVPALNDNIYEMGVGVLYADDGTLVATIVVGVAIGDAMPGEWKDILCANGTLRTSGDGYTGITCEGTPDSGVTEIFTLTVGDLGLSIASLHPNVPADLVADAFFEANV